MMTTSKMLDYLEKRPSAPESDPAMAQAIIDGYAQWDGAGWCLKGRILPGERRLVRFDDGSTLEVRG